MRILPVLFLGAASVARAAGFEGHHLSTVHGDQPGSSFGAAVASPGDVNGDGFADLVVGAPDYNGAAGPHCGKAFLFLGSATGYSAAASWSAEGDFGGGRFGEVVAPAGDVNRDGFDDVAIGEPEYDPPNDGHARFPGRLYVYLGSAQGLTTTPAMVFIGRDYDLGFHQGIGSTIATGDVNGDGFADVVAGQYTQYVGGSRVFYGAAQGPSPDNGTYLAPYVRYGGSSVAVADINADGFDDVFFSHRIPYSAPEPGPTTVVYLGSSTGLPDLPPPGEPPTPAFVFEQWNKVANVGDLDRDGYDDVVAALGNADTGEVMYHVFFRGSAAGPQEEGERSPVLGLPGRLTPIGDLNGDGFPDVITDDGGSFYLYLGSPTGFLPIGDGMGRNSLVFAGGGDANRDGFDDLIAGDPANERVDVYRGAADWSFTVRADLSVQMEWTPAIFWITVRNLGPDTARVRVRDLLPTASGFGGSLGCYRSTGGAAAACLDSLGRERGSLDSLLTIQPDAEIFYYTTPGAAVMPFVNTVSVVPPDWVIDPDLSNNQASVVLAPPEEELFSDGFESGTLAAWSASSPRGLTVEPAAALEGAYGLRVEAPLGGEAVVRDDRPTSESAYHARFRLDASAFGAARRGELLQATLFRGSGSGDRALFDIRLERRDRRLFLVGRAWSDEGGAINLPPIPLADGPHVLDVGWRRASSPTSRDGVFALQLDGVDVGGVPSLDNDSRGGVETVELGLALRAFRRPAGTPRFVRLDSFASWRMP